MSNWKAYCLGLFTAYVFTGAMSGIAMSRAIPALNGIGKAYVAATWPGAMFCAATQITGCTVMPPAGSALANTFFTFSDKEPGE